MSRRSAATLLMLAAVPPAARAQSASPWADSARRLSSELAALKDSLLRRDSAVIEVARRGDLVISASPGLEAAAASALDRFAAERARWFGSATPSAEGFRIVIRSTAELTWRAAFLTGTREVVLSGLPDSGRAPRIFSNRSWEPLAHPAGLGRVLLEQFAELLYPTTASAIRSWLPDHPPLAMPDIERRREAMRALVTASGAVARRCAAGELSGCAAALGLRGPRLHQSDGSYGTFLRADFLLFALESGGPRAWARLNDPAPADLADRLAAAARMPADSLLAGWRRGLLSLQPAEAPVRAGGVLLALGWSAAILLGALGLSRWT